jgi:hypothetical protein
MRAIQLWSTVAATAALTLSAPTAAKAQYTGTAPWCAYMGYLGTFYECNYYSLEQCMERASGVSNSCTVNPWYVAEPARAKPRRRAGPR